jgi:signal transduction histidine kinase
VVATEILTFLLIVVSFSEVVISANVTETIFRSGVFVGLLGFSILLIKSVLKEVEQREQLQELTKKLEATNKELADLNKFKTGMLSLAAHQVKSPLGVIKQFATILIDGLYGPLSEKVKETLGKMKHRADELIILINELIDVRKLEEGKMEYHFDKVKMADVVAEVFENLKPLAAEKKLEFALSLESNAMVSVDVQKFKQVLQNLIDNSIKYTPSPSAASGQVGFVRVSLKDEKPMGQGKGAGVLFSVADSGLGISSELLPNLFEEFVRDEQVKKKILGTGLGLSIAKRILDAHGGTIWAESGGEGKGSAFFVRLPVVE